MQGFPFLPEHQNATSVTYDAQPIVAARKLLDNFYNDYHPNNKSSGIPVQIASLLRCLMSQRVPPTIGTKSLEAAQPPNEIDEIIAQLKFLYICLTQTYFAIHCPCEEPKAHCFYDHLLGSLLLSRIHHARYGNTFQQEFNSCLTNADKLHHAYLLTHPSIVPLSSMLLTLMPFASQMLPDKYLPILSTKLFDTLTYYQKKLPNYYIRYVAMVGLRTSTQPTTYQFNNGDFRGCGDIMQQELVTDDLFIVSESYYFSIKKTSCCIL